MQAEQAERELVIASRPGRGEDRVKKWSQTVPAELDFRLPPFSHQRKVWEETTDLEGFALFWEMGTGKSSAMIHLMCTRFLEGEIDGVIVVAPPGVDRNWLTDELPAHLTESVAPRVSAVHYKTLKSKTKWHQAELARLLHHDGLAILLISYDAFMTEAGKNYVWKFLRKRKVLYILDESHNIKTPSTKRTQSIVKSGRWARQRRILSGTPVSQGPFDVYSQMRFIDPEFWHPLGIHTFTEFKQYFGVWEKSWNNTQQKEFDVLVAYKNIDELYAYIANRSSRVLKDEVLDLPPKLYSRRYFDLSREQRNAYEQLRDEYLAKTEHGMVSAELAIVRMLRMQQTLCGYLPMDDEDGELRALGNDNPRLELLESLTDVMPHQAIIWSRFSRDIELICHMLGPRAVRYDGKISDDECQRSKEAFQRGDAQFFVSNPQKGATGLTLHMAKTVIYYSNSFKLIDRLQSEDRAHRAGMDDNPVNYIDLLGEIDGTATLDLRVLTALRSKFDIASQITGDKLREWI